MRSYHFHNLRLLVMRIKLPLIAAALASLLMTGVAQAATDAALSITAKVLPSACSLDIDDNGIFNYGDRPASALSPSGPTDLLPQQKGYVLACQAPTFVGMKIIDNQAGTSYYPSPTLFGLGLDATGNKIGTSAYRLKSGSNNGVPTNYITPSLINGFWINQGSEYELSPIDSMVTFAVETGVTPIAVTNVASAILVVVAIAPASGLDTTRAININGSATLELVYF